MSLDTPSRVAIVLVNFVGAADTIECLESLCALETFQSGEKVVVYVVDNGSPDGSLAILRGWLEAKGSVVSSTSNWPVREIDGPDMNLQVVLVQSPVNKGFAAGCNLGLATAFRDPSIAHFWLLNNDTTVHPRAAIELLTSSRQHADRSICGSTLLYDDDREVVQAAGGAQYVHLIGRSRHYLKGKRISEIEDAPLPEFDYIVGASMFFSRDVLNLIGFLPERYFLYVEETEWCTRARRMGISLEWARKSYVFHKEGRSTGAEARFAKLGDHAFYFTSRNNLLYTWDHARIYMLPVTIYTLLLAVSYAFNGDLAKLKIALKSVRDFWRLRNQTEALITPL